MSAGAVCIHSLVSSFRSLSSRTRPGAPSVNIRVNCAALVPEGNRDRQYHQSIQSVDRDQHFCPFNHFSDMIKDEDKQTAGANKAVLEQINSLKREDERLYNILAIDVWALAKTMDEYQPGFWAAFMKNREKALKRFLAGMMKNKPADTKRPPFLR
ncbi:MULTISPECIES: hypothetical protein [unclassified Microcoleus]|uniref:hypothetical protein n=1 Tax=unclassified Microcoleus TaxID=2642155 RepID=UPI002FD18863